MLCSGTKFDATHVKYKVVREALAKLGIKEIPDESDADIIWFDGSIPNDFFFVLKDNQRINRIPGMDCICYKSNTFQALNTMRSQHIRMFNFFPLTFLLPQQYSEFQREHIKECNKCQGPATWIIKPRAGCCGNGIKLIQNTFELAESKTPCIAQSYIQPYLVDGYKFDFRFYLCISTLKPFTVFIYNEGIARFCTKKYSSPTKQTLDDKFAHLTNTAVNVKNESLSNLEFTRLAKDVIAQISANDTRGKDLWEKIKVASTLTCCAIYSPIITSILNFEVDKKTYLKEKKVSYSRKQSSLPLLQRYFHIIGIDVLLNDKMDPIILELNDKPSLHVTFGLEAKLKPQLIYDALSLIEINGNAPDLAQASKNWELLLPISDDTMFGASVNSIIDKTQKDLLPRMRMVSRNKIPQTQRLPPLRPCK